MRILALETSSLRGSVALMDVSARAATEPQASSSQAAPLGEADTQPHRVAAYLKHEVLNEHAERMLPLVEQAFLQSGWQKRDIDTIAVGVGPGSFTGVRVALSLAQGLMLGLGVPGVGVGSLRALAAGWDTSPGSATDPRIRVVVRDARRDEFFLAAYARDGTEVIAPHAIPQKDAVSTILAELELRSLPVSGVVVLGTLLEGLPCDSTDETVEPDARAVGRLAATLSPLVSPVAPHYVRGPNVVAPVLPESPLGRPRSR